MKQKIGALLLALAMGMSLAACGGKEPEATPAPTEPAAEASVEPTAAPSAEPSAEATAAPSAEPTVEATAEPTKEPDAEPTKEAMAVTTPEPTPEAKPEPTPEPTPEPAPKTYKAGTYTGSAQGFGGSVVATVTVDDDNITDVTITGDSETPTIGGAALETLAANAKAAGADMDGVSGATMTSNGAKEAVAAALAQAKN